MGRQQALAALMGEPVLAHGLMWVTAAALRGLTWDSDITGNAESLCAVAVAFGVDMVLVESTVNWAGEAAALLREHDIAVAWAVPGVLSRVAATHGWTETITASVKKPGELAYALDEALHEMLVSVRHGQSVNAEILVVADELASTAGWLVSPDFALDGLVPSYARAASEWLGKPAIFHSDGDIRVLYAILARAGYAGVHLAPATQAQLGAAAVAAHAAGLCPVGGLAAQSLRSEGARRTAEYAAAVATPPFVFADDGGMTSAEELAAFGAALDTLRHLDESQGER